MNDQTPISAVGSRLLLDTIKQAASPRVRLRLSDYTEVTGSIVGMGPQIGECLVRWDDTDEVTIIGRYRLEMLTTDNEAK